MLIDADGDRQATIIATGSEVALAVEARTLLQAKGIATAVVSMPCMELFEVQEEAYRLEVLGTAPRVAVEAGISFGWTRYVADEADVVGMSGFGASGKAAALFEHFGITAQAVEQRVQDLISRA